MSSKNSSAVNEETVFRYHRETKHDFPHYARSLGYLDWASQPHPFRYYERAPNQQLPWARQSTAVPYSALYRCTPLQPARPLSLESLAEFFRYSLGLSAWKQYRSSRWALRVNPSSGNLHPTEGYAVLGSVAGWSEEGGVYHYVSETHTLETRATFAEQVWQEFMGLCPSGSFLVVITSIYWREVWKYGERGFRYCQHDAGHALAALRLAAALLGWKLRLIAGCADEEIAVLVGLQRHEEFAPEEEEGVEFLALVTPAGVEDHPFGLSPPFVEAVRKGSWFGQANRLSSSHHRWKIIEEVSLACKNPGQGAQPSPFWGWETMPEASEPDGEIEARKIILQRRSGLNYDPQHELAQEAFGRILLRLLPRNRCPWDALYWNPGLHLVFFVHRVTGLEQGIYLLVRHPAALPLLREHTHRDFAWEKPAGFPVELPFFLLSRADVEYQASHLSCDQEIAGRGYFSLGMIAEFALPIQTHGPWFYRNLFWEAGLIGQVLYLEAEATGCRGTGIGCYYDNLIHDCLGLRGSTFQSLYHFAVGFPIEDERLTTLPAYADEKQRSSF